MGNALAAKRALGIARRCDGTVNAHWIKLLGHASRDAGSFELADLAYEWGVSVARKNGDIEEEVWNSLNRSRVRFHARDLAGANEFYRQTMEILRQRPDQRSGADMWALIEYGYFLTAMDRQSDAEKPLEAGIKLLDQNPEWYSGKDERFYRLVCLVMMGCGDEVREELTDFLTDDSVAQDIRTWVFVEQLVKSPRLDLESLDPIDEFEKYCGHLQPYAAAFFQDRENDYVDWMADRNELPRAMDFLRQMLEQRDAEYGIRNPERAWTRVRLAKALLRDGTDLTKARELANEAVEILKNHPFVPEERIDEIQSLNAEIEAKIPPQ